MFWNKTANKSKQNQTMFSLLPLIVHIIKMAWKIDSLIIQAVRLNQIALAYAHQVVQAPWMTQLGWLAGRLRSFEEQSAFSSASPSHALPEIRVWVAINFEIAWDSKPNCNCFFFLFFVCLRWKREGCCRSAFSLSCKWTSHPWGFDLCLYCQIKYSCTKTLLLLHVLQPFQSPHLPSTGAGVEVTFKY